MDYDRMAEAIRSALDGVMPSQIVVESVSTPRPVDAVDTHEPMYTRELIVDKGSIYDRETSPLLFAVIDWLDQQPADAQLSVRIIAAGFERDTGQSVSKSWAAVAARYRKFNMKG